MKIKNKFISPIFRHANNAPNTSRALLNRIPKEYSVTLKEIQTGKYKSPIAREMSRLMKDSKNNSFNDFIDKSALFILKKFNISQNITPPIQIYEKLNTFEGAYFLGKHLIGFSKHDMKKYGKELRFGMVSHELRHLVQAYDGLRAESLKDISVYKLGKLSLKDDKNTVLESVKHLTVDNLDNFKNRGMINEKVYNINVMAKRVINGEVPLSEFEKIHSETFLDDFVNAWKNVQAKVINEMGVIKSGTKKSEKAEKLFNSILEPEEHLTDKYFKSPHEKDAYFIMAYFIDLYKSVRANNIKNLS